MTVVHPSQRAASRAARRLASSFALLALAAADNGHAAMDFGTATDASSGSMASDGFGTNQGDVNDCLHCVAVSPCGDGARQASVIGANGSGSPGQGVISAYAVAEAAVQPPAGFSAQASVRSW